MLNIYKQLLTYLIQTYKHKVFFSILLSLISTLLQVFSFGLIYFFISKALSIEKNLLIDNQNLNFYKRLFDDEINLITFSLIISLLFLCIGIMRFYFQVYLFKFSQNISISTKEKIIENFFYTNFKTQNELSKSKIYNYLGLYVDRFTEASLSVMNFINNNLLILGTMLLVFSINYTSLIIIFFLSLVLYLLYFFIKNFVNKYSVLEEKNSRKINKEINKIVFSFKDFILLNQSELIIAKVKNYLFNSKSYKLFIFMLSIIPRYILEILILFSLILITNILYLSEKNFIEYIPLLSLHFVICLRILPVFSALSRDVVLLKKNELTVKEFLNYKNNNPVNLKKKIKKKSVKKENYFLFKNLIDVNNVKFLYNKTKEFKYNFTFKKNSWTIISGESGSGKSTLVNLIVGFINPHKGQIKFDKFDLKKNLNEILPIIGFVTQDTILFEGTICENICFDSKLSKNNLEYLKKLYKICGIDTFISFEKFLIKKINFNASTLSGGQKQRITLARALFQKPKILLLDESLNALDKNSEKKILSNIKKNYNLTLIYVSHHRPLFGFDQKIDLSK